jgi:hypothetical protein
MEIALGELVYLFDGAPTLDRVGRISSADRGDAVWGVSGAPAGRKQEPPSTPSDYAEEWNTLRIRHTGQLLGSFPPDGNGPDRQNRAILQELLMPEEGFEPPTRGL